MPSSTRALAAVLLLLGGGIYESESPTSSPASYSIAAARGFRAEVFPGGCFFCNIQAEFDSRPDNAVRDVVTENMHQFLGFLEREIRKAQEAGELDPSVEPAQLAAGMRARLGAA